MPAQVPAQVGALVTCVCGAVKGQTNHWWVCIPSLSLHRDPYWLMVPLGKEEIMRADEMGNRYPGIIVCGEACAAKELSKWMQQQKEQSQNG